MRMRIIILGASGSIGAQALDVIKQYSEQYELCGVSVGLRTDCLDSIIQDYQIKYITVKNQSDLERLQPKYPNIRFFSGDEGLLQLINESSCDLVINALIGLVGLRPTLETLRQHKQLALANKESLVIGGKLVTSLAKKNNILIRPIDSEHSAIFQCLQGNKISQVNRLIITASGGSLRDVDRSQLAKVTVNHALAHPTWSMGKKITIDSATMMNKGFEVMEAHWLFGIPYSQIETILHPQSVIHSMVEFQDHSLLAQLGVPDMRIPIQYALMNPEHCPNTSNTLDLKEIGDLRFENLSFERYPLLKLAYEVGEKGGNLGAILNGANEAAVELFLNKKINLLQLEGLIQDTISLSLKDKHFIEGPDEQQLIASDLWAYHYVKEKIQ